MKGDAVLVIPLTMLASPGVSAAIIEFMRASTSAALSSGCVERLRSMESSGADSVFTPFSSTCSGAATLRGSYPTGRIKGDAVLVIPLTMLASPGVSAAIIEFMRTSTSAALSGGCVERLRSMESSEADSVFTPFSSTCSGTATLRGSYPTGGIKEETDLVIPLVMLALLRVGAAIIEFMRASTSAALSGGCVVFSTQ